MGVGYTLINATRRERLAFAHIPATTRWEIIGHPVAASMVACYLLQHIGDDIRFVPDDGSCWPFDSISPEEPQHIPEKTEHVVAALIREEMRVEQGRESFDEHDPECYMRRLVRVWSGGGFPASGA